MNREEGWACRECWRREGALGRSHCGEMMGQMKKACGGEEGDRWRGKTLLLYCVANPEHCHVQPQHSISSVCLHHSVIILIIIMMMMTTTMLKKYI